MELRGKGDQGPSRKVTSRRGQECKGSVDNNNQEEETIFQEMESRISGFG